MSAALVFWTGADSGVLTDGLPAKATPAAAKNQHTNVTAKLPRKANLHKHFTRIFPPSSYAFREDGGPAFRGRQQPARRPKLGAWIGTIDQILEEDKAEGRKQRHTTKRIFERLRDDDSATAAYPPRTASFHSARGRLGTR